MHILEVDKSARRRLHTVDSFKARIKALGVQEPDFSKVRAKDLDVGFFRIATGDDLLARPARENGAWGSGTGRKEPCRVCGSTGKDPVMKEFAFDCARCYGRGVVIVHEDSDPLVKAV